jgi:dTDP-4-dehydrorhamnose reductase
MKVLVLGDGLLGSEIVKQSGWNYVSRKTIGTSIVDDFELYQIECYPYDVIVNCIAFTKTYSEDRQQNWDLNFKMVVDLSNFCQTEGKKLVHISTDYVYSDSITHARETDVPVHCKTWYGYTKLLGDGYAQLNPDNLIIRTSFKPNPFPYDKAVLQVGSFDYVDVISEKIIKLIENGASGVYNVGSEPKTMYELAKRTNPMVEYTTDSVHTLMPRNIIMNTNKMEQFLK